MRDHRACEQSSCKETHSTKLILAASRFPQLALESPHVRPAVGRFPSECTSQHPTHHPGDLAPTAPTRALRLEPMPAGVGFVDDERSRVLITGLRRLQSGELFGCHVGARTYLHTRPGKRLANCLGINRDALRNSEVDQDGIPPVPEHIGRLHVPMDNAMLVCMLECFEQIPTELQCRQLRYRAGA